MKLSMLDVSINPYQGDRKQALKIAIEPCGFQHTWEGKHHSLRNLALYTPEIPIAATTENPKHMNSGLGFALPNLYRPDKIAVAFAALINSYGIHQVAGLTVYFGETDHVIPWQTDHLICWRTNVSNAIEALTKVVI
ncbi:hypothetical protein [Pedobacter helvus]|uniref:Uncharacterized protein n=1 Tax=Pedobacter helvus TaxID=2563444 RepID=A0ABW9JJT4_9SPHI|nr:hypothetical protein [Pedobacter ureilyticus]